MVLVGCLEVEGVGCFEVEGVFCFEVGGVGPLEEVFAVVAPKG